MKTKLINLTWALPSILAFIAFGFGLNDLLDIINLGWSSYWLIYMELSFLVVILVCGLGWLWIIIL